MATEGIGAHRSTSVPYRRIIGPLATRDRHGPDKTVSLLRLVVFRSLLLATFASNVGGWMEDVGETWLMTSLHGTPLMVALVQTSASLPVFLFALPAGTLADIIDRRGLLLVTHVWMLLVAALLGVLTITEHIGASGLLTCTFAMGIGSALAGPAWQAVVADVVPQGDLPRATTLDGVAFNVGRVAGPALGGLIVARAGPGPTFLLNALSFVSVLAALLRWKRRHHPSVLPAERVWTGMRTGLRYVRDAPTLRALLIRTFTTLFFASALWALLPSFVNRALRGTPSQYGTLLAALGAGAVASAALVSRWRDRFGSDAVIMPAVLLLGAAIGGLALAPSLAWSALATFVAGSAWLTIVSTSTAAAQKSSAEWVRARALAVYILVSEGAMAGGSVLWGWLATRTSVRLAIGAAGMGVAASVGVAFARRLRDLDRIDRSPTEPYPIPDAPSGTDRDKTPVVVEVEYHVAAGNRAAFREALGALGRGRRRTGAAMWIMTEDSQDPSRFVELFFLESWNEHHRQHGRWTKHDEKVWHQVRSLVMPGTEPKVAHLLGLSSATVT
jgi:MFS family permease